VNRRDFLRGVVPLPLLAAGYGRTEIDQDRTGAEPLAVVAPVLGKPTLLLNGRPVPGPIFETYVPEERYYREFAAAGTRAFSFSIWFNSPTIWKPGGVWDFSDLDLLAARVLAAKPDALLLPRIYLGPPDWWLAANPDEAISLDDGTKSYPSSTPTPVPKNRLLVSAASPKWRAEAGEGLRRLMAHASRAGYGNQVLGFQLTGLMTEEWYHWSSGCERMGDYGRHTLEAWRSWLRRRYASDAALRKAWRNPSVTLDSARPTTVPIPTQPQRMGDRTRTFRDPAAERNVLDFHRFYNEIVPETIETFARIVKQESAGRLITGAFYGYLFEFDGDPEFGHNALSRLIRSPYIDLVMMTASYYDRQIGTGADYMRAPMTSVARHGKLWYHDNDTISFRYRQMFRERGMKEGYGEGEFGNEAIHLGATDTPEQTIQLYRRGAGFVLGEGIVEALFDLHGGYFDDPALMAEVARLNRLFADSADRDRSSVSRILVVADEISCSYASARSPLLARTLRPPQRALVQCGAPYDCVLIDDLDRLDMAPYRLVIFLNAWFVPHARRNLIRRTVLNDNRTVLWCYAPGYFDEEGPTEESMQRLTGIRIRASIQDTFVTPNIAIAPSSHPLSRLLARTKLTTIGPDARCCKLFHVDDASATPLGHLPGSDSITLAAKRLDGWNSVYSITPDLPPAFYRELARFAGVPIVNEHDDALYLSRSYLTVHASSAGPRTLTLPYRCDIFDAISGQLLAPSATHLTRDLAFGETLLLRLE
jgi:beta-galactosidase